MRSFIKLTTVSSAKVELTYIELFARERSVTDTCCVSFHHSDDLTNSLRGNSETSEHATDGTVAAGDVRVRAEVNVQHGSVCAFNQHSFAVTQCRVKIEDRVFDERTHLLGVFFVARQLSVDFNFAAGEQSLMRLDNRSESKNENQFDCTVMDIQGILTCR